MRAWLFMALLVTACSASLRRPVVTTDAVSALEQVTRSSANEFDPAVSPSANAVAYEVASSADSDARIEVMSLTDPSHGVLYDSRDTVGLEPAWTPDGSSLVFVSKTKHGSERLMQTFGQGIAKTAFVAAAGDPYMAADWPAVAPNGSTMAMSLPRVQLYESGWRKSRRIDHALGLSDLRGTGVTVVGQGTDPAFSPDGKLIAFARFTGGHTHLFVANADGTNPRQVTDGPADDAEPSWSPDGERIVFSSAHGDDHWTQSNLFVVHRDGSGIVQLTEGDRVVGHPSWGRDGFIYFHANAGNHFHIWRLRVAL